MGGDGPHKPGYIPKGKDGKQNRWERRGAQIDSWRTEKKEKNKS